MRRKVKLAFVIERAKRKETYKKRKRSLLKKLNELTTLCGVEACAVISSEFESEPEFWPSKKGVESGYARFKRMPQVKQTKHMLNLEKVIQQRIDKVEESFENQVKENHKKEMTILMWECLAGKSDLDHLSAEDMGDLGRLIDQNLEYIDKRVKELQPHNGADQVATGTDNAGALAGGLTQNQRPIDDLLE